jgi:hypothetical protein
MTCSLQGDISLCLSSLYDFSFVTFINKKKSIYSALHFLKLLALHLSAGRTAFVMRAHTQVKGFTNNESRFDSQQKQKIFFSTATRPALGPTPTFCPMDTGKLTTDLHLEQG